MRNHLSPVAAPTMKKFLAQPENVSTADTATTAVPAPPATPTDVEAAKYLGDACHHLQAELGRVIVGQERVIEELLVAIFARGHCIMQGVPGLAKTMMVSTLAQTMDLSFSR